MHAQSLKFAESMDCSKSIIVSACANWINEDENSITRDAFDYKTVSLKNMSVVVRHTEREQRMLQFRAE